MSSDIIQARMGINYRNHKVIMVIITSNKNKSRKRYHMLLQNHTTEQIDYLQNWPERYYEIPTAAQRMEILDAAQKQGLTTDIDYYRKTLCEKRFFSKNAKGTVDSFLNAWMMIKASSTAGVSFLQKKKLRRELETYMDALCLIHYEPACEEALTARTEEWHDFARYFIHSCTDSKTYCSTLFGFVPIKDSVIAEKIASEIMQVTVDYPAKFGLDSEFAPLMQAMCEVYCQMIENGKTYLHHPAQP